MKKIKLFLMSVFILLGILMVSVYAVRSCFVKAPRVSEAEFSFSITYKYKGDVEKIEHTILCKKEMVFADKPTWIWNSFIVEGEEEKEFGQTVFKEELDGGQLVILTNFIPGYLMSDPLYKDSYNNENPYRPICAFYSEDGTAYTSKAVLDALEFELMSWEYPTPIENEFRPVFLGISQLGSDNVIPMALFATVVLALCVLFIKKESCIVYGALDRATIIMNYAIGIIVIPLMAAICMLLDVGVSGSAFGYKMHLISYTIPAVSVLGLSASVSLRRIGYTKSGLVAQLIGPIAFIAILIFEFVVS